MDEKKLEQIKEKIRTINPDITNEVLDLLYEYICTRYTNELFDSLKDEKVQEAMKEVTLNRLITK